jgi:hypothetical protein
MIFLFHFHPITCKTHLKQKNKISITITVVLKNKNILELYKTLSN